MTAFANGDKCVSIKAGPDIVRIAVRRVIRYFLLNSRRNADLGGKCSSSQTGFGTKGNFVK